MKWRFERREEEENDQPKSRKQETNERYTPSFGPPLSSLCCCCRVELHLNHPPSTTSLFLHFVVDDDLSSLLPIRNWIEVLQALKLRQEFIEINSREKWAKHLVNFLSPGSVRKRKKLEQYWATNLIRTRPCYVIHLSCSPSVSDEKKEVADEESQFKSNGSECRRIIEFAFRKEEGE